MSVGSMLGGIGVVPWHYLELSSKTIAAIAKDSVELPPRET